MPSDESCHMCEWVMSHMQMSHVACANESCSMCEWVMSRVRMSHVTCANESYRMWRTRVSSWTYIHEEDSSSASTSADICTCGHIHMKIVTRTTESCHMHEWVMSRMSSRTSPSYMSECTHIHNEFSPVPSSPQPSARAVTSMNENFTQTTESCHTFEWMSGVMYAMPHLTFTYEFMNTHTRTISSSVSTSARHLHVRSRIKKRHTNDWVMSDMWMSDVCHACHAAPAFTYDYYKHKYTENVLECFHHRHYVHVRSHIWMSAVTRTHKSRYTC